MGGLMIKDNATTSIAKELIRTMELQLLKKNIKKLDLFVSSNNIRALQLYINLNFKEQRKLMIKDIYE